TTDDRTSITGMRKHHGYRPAPTARPPRGTAGAAGRVSAVVLAAGSGSRFTGSFIPKQFVSLMGKPILAYILETYQNLDLVDDVTLVVNPRYEQLYYDIVDTYRFFKVRRMVKGGATRQAASEAGLYALVH